MKKLFQKLNTKEKQDLVLGPDVSLCDDRLIVIESKSKRLSACSRVDPTDNNFLYDIRSVLKALDGLPQKIEDMYSCLPEYSKYQDQINETKNTKPIAIVIMGEGIPLILEVIQDQIIRNMVDRLINFPIPFLLLDLNLFEKIISICYSTKRSFSEVIEKYSISGNIHRINSIYQKIDKEYRELKEIKKYSFFHTF